MEHTQHEGLEKFLLLDLEKRERIINAAMAEFATGYKKASTDNIVRAAGISKGLLFHYFGTKERLYEFVIDYAIDTVQHEFVDLLNISQPDILEFIMQASLLKGDLSQRFPMTFDFLAKVYVEAAEMGVSRERLQHFMQIQGKIRAEAYANADFSLFRGDIDPEKAINAIWWSLEGWANALSGQLQVSGENISVRENYDKYLAQCEEYLAMFRCCFYKQQD